MPPRGRGFARAARRYTRARLNPVPAELGTFDEASLIASLRAGSDAAYEQVVRQYAARMRAAALRLLRNPEDADDAVQEAFLSAFKALARFEGRSGLGTWLQRIAINAALMKLRARKPIEEGAVDEHLPRFVGHGVFAEPVACWGDPCEPALREELVARVREAIGSLPERFRIPLVLRDIEGLSNDEVAAQLSISTNAAKIRVHRARQAVRALLETTWKEHRA
jgi:RNA polymerase sigma-70 factor (ECF subfamily)